MSLPGIRDPVPYWIADAPRLADISRSQLKISGNVDQAVPRTGRLEGDRWTNYVAGVNSAVRFGHEPISAKLLKLF